MQRALFTISVMSGAGSHLQTGHGKDSEAPGNAVFVWMGGGLVFGDGILTKQIHLSWFRFQEVELCRQRLIQEKKGHGF